MSDSTIVMCTYCKDGNHGQCNGKAAEIAGIVLLCNCSERGHV